MPGTQLYTPGIHRADTRRILEPILFCQAIEIKDPTSLRTSQPKGSQAHSVLSVFESETSIEDPLTPEPINESVEDYLDPRFPSDPPPFSNLMAVSRRDRSSCPVLDQERRPCETVDLEIGHLDQ